MSSPYSRYINGFHKRTEDLEYSIKITESQAKVLVDEFSRWSDPDAIQSYRLSIAQFTLIDSWMVYDKKLEYFLETSADT